MKNFFKATGFIAAYLAIYLVLQTIYLFVLSLITVIKAGIEAATIGDTTLDLDNTTTAFEEALQLNIPIAVILATIVSLFIYYFICKGRKQNIFEVCIVSGISMKNISLMAVAGITLYLFNVYLMSFIKAAGFMDGSFNNLEDLFRGLFEGNFALGFISIAIAAPLIEEIIFRGLIMSELKKHMNIIPAVIIQAFLFGIYHFNMVQLIYAVLMGVILGFVCVWLKSIWGAVIIHIVNNATSYLITRFEQGNFLEQYVNILLPLSIVVTVCIIYYIFKNRTRETESVMQVQEVSA